MTFLQVTAAGVLLLAFAYLIVGWILSNRLYVGAFVVGARPKDLEVRVRSVDRDRIVLESPTPRQDIGHPGIMGLIWDDGYGRVGDVVAADATTITRAWIGPGTPPPCVGPLEGCPPVELDSFAYQRNPADAGLDFETTTYRSPLGEMGAWLIPAGSGTRWAVHCHGWTAERRELVRMLPAFHRSGVTSMVIDYRNDPGAPGDPTGRYRFGLTEWEDLEAAVALALERGAEDIVLSGCSTGGALVMGFLERSNLADRVAAVVLDAPNIVLADTFRHATDLRRATPLMLELGMWIADLRWKIDWDTTNYVPRAERILHVPTLVFHGTSDRTVPISVSRQLAARVPDLVRLVETPAAGHVMSWNADPDTYERRLEQFLSDV